MMSNRILSFFCIIFMILSIFTGIKPTEVEGKDGSFGGGSGTKEDPHIIEDIWDLQNISNQLSAHYILNNDIDGSSTKTWNEGAGFLPIGTISNKFLGSMDGRNHTISRISINASSRSQVGLFGYSSLYSIVKNLRLNDINVTGNQEVGGLVGFNRGTVSNCNITGNINGANQVGGIVGDNRGKITYCFSSINVNGDQEIGGIVGANGKAVSNCHSDGNVSGYLGVGGISGYTGGSISDSYFRGSVNGGKSVGGIIGGSDGLNNSHYNIDVVLINGDHHITPGGLFDAQYNDWFSNGLSLNISHYHGTIVPSGDHYNISNVQGLRDLLGFSDEKGYRFQLSSDIDLYGAPGLYIPSIGSNEFDGNNHTISNLFINMTFRYGLGMIGYNDGGMIKNLKINNSLVIGEAIIGGLVGVNKGEISNCFVIGNIRGDDAIGGLIGYNGGNVYGSHSTGNVSGGGEVGGLVGENDGAIYNSNFTGKISGIQKVGGIGGDNNGVISNCSVTANIDGTWGTGSYMGGLIGENHGIVSYCNFTRELGWEKLCWRWFQVPIMGQFPIVIPLGILLGMGRLADLLVTIEGLSKTHIALATSADTQLWVDLLDPTTSPFPTVIPWGR